MKEKRRHISGATGTIIFHAILLVLLYFFGFRQLIPDNEEGILINFGDSPTGTGNIEPKPTPVAQTTPPPPPQATTPPKVSTPTVSDAEKLNTQDFEESVAMKSAEKKRKKEEEAKKQQEVKEEADRKRKQEELVEKQRLEAIEAEKQRKIEEQRKAEELARIEQERIEKEEREAKARQAEAISKRTANVFAAAGKASGNTTSEGDKGGTGNQGSANGDPNSKSRTGSGLGSSGNSYSLAGRSLVGTLPAPVYNIQEEGIVVVQIEVDRTGKVISATPSLRGSTTQNTQLWQKAKEAALKARFNANPAATTKQLGTITYHFQLD